MRFLVQCISCEHLLELNIIISHNNDMQLATKLLTDKQKGGLSGTNDGFYESKREWLGHRHFLLAFEGYDEEPL